MRKQLTKGNEAIVKAAVLGGCRAYYGYPITPASEIAEAAAEYLPACGGVFLQAESEVAAINMLYGGAAKAGVRAMTASSGPGIKPDAGGHELPGRGGAALRSGGHHARGPRTGEYRPRAGRLQPGGEGRGTRLLPHAGAGAGVGQVADLTALAFELADRYRNPAVVLADGCIGQMMEPVEFADPRPVPPPPEWAVIQQCGHGPI